MDKLLRVEPLACILLLLACGDSTAGDAASNVTTAGGSSGDSAEVTTAGGASSSGGAATGSTGSAGSSSGEPEPKFDVGSKDAGGVGSACEQAEAELSNQGCEFWAVDLPNAWKVSLTPGAEDQQFAVVATNTAEATANVSVYAGADDVPLESAAIPGGGLWVFSFDNALGTKTQENSYGTAYRVESDLPITVYQFNPLDNTTEVYSNDASLLFPAHVLDQDYTAVTGDAISLVGKNGGAFVTVVGIEDDTVVEFFPPAGIPLYPGVLTLTVDRGQTYTLMSNAVLSPLQNEPGQGNLSGTRVQADKPVAVFSGNICSFEPSPWIDCCCDHLEHQMLPLSAWGRSYVVVAAPPNLGDEEDKVRVRLTGSFDDTALSYAPAKPAGAPASIDAYETAVFEASAPFIVSSEQPFAITQFILSNEYITVDPTPNDAADDGWWPGDPAMILVPPIDQYRGRYVFFVPQEYEVNYVTIVRRAGATVRLDAADVSGDPGWQDVAAVDGVTWQRAHFPLEFGAHSVEAEGDETVGITVVGLDAAVSFGYAGGSGVEYIDVPPLPPAG